MTTADTTHAEHPADQVNIRPAAEADLARVAALDAQVTGLSKPDYWSDIYERYSKRRVDQRFFLVAEPVDAGADAGLLGFIVGEIRAWEFGSEPCGWIFAFSVDPDTRLKGVGEQLFQAIAAKFAAAGIQVMRTMVERSNQLHMAFFRSEGMTAGRYIQLELELD